MEEQPIEVWIVEDDPDYRERLHELIDQAPTMHCGLLEGACEPVIAALESGRLPDVVLMDLACPGVDDLAGIRRVRGLAPSCHVVVLTGRDDERAFAAICAGASSYLVKPATSRQIVGAIEMAVAGGAVMSASIARRIADAFALAAFAPAAFAPAAPVARPAADHGLTGREREILERLVAGESQKRIAHALEISPHTVDTHVRNIYAKLQVRSRAGAIAKALRASWR